jgi:hypothetical protein
MLRPRRRIHLASHRPSSGRKPPAQSPSRRRFALGPESLESRRLLTTFVVTNTLDNGSDVSPTPGSLRAAMVASNLATPGPNAIAFEIPASTAANLDTPVAGFDPDTQTWTITPDGPLPTITTPVDIDGFTEANTGVPYNYPNQVTLGGAPTEITSSPNTTQAIDGNNARVRIIIDGSDSGGATGFVLDASHSMLRGLIVNDFGVGVEVPNANDVGDAIQGDFIGSYLLYPVDPNTGEPLPSPSNEEIVGSGNAQQGVIIAGANTTLGGASAQDDVVIAGNEAEGVWIQSTARGSQVLGCQIGVVGPSDNGVYWSPGNGAQGVLVQSSSDLIGAANAGNVISADTGDGVELDQGATQVQVAANYIGVPPGGGYKFGDGVPGNGGDGIDIIGAANNTVGGTSSGAGNAISSNAGDGVDISGATATGNIVSNNLIGVTSDGSQALGNALAGVAVTSPNNQVGPGNVISANEVGVEITGATTTGIIVNGNLIGTDLSGAFDLGNTYQGVLVDAAIGVTIEGSGDGSQVISGNDVGIEIDDAAYGALIEGTFIGTDKTGTIALPNAQQGILIDGGAWDNTIGGATTATRNLISTNHWGIEINGGPPSGPSANAVTGNLIGTDITGQLPLGNEIDGVTISDSSGNTIGGLIAAQGNTIGFNTDAGVHVVSGTADTIESNSIFSNGTLGIQLDGTSNDNLPAPTVHDALPDAALQSTEIDLSYTGKPLSSYLIQFFSTPGTVAQGGVQGETFIGATSVRTDSNGAIIGLVGGIYAVDVAVVVTTGDWVTATATVLSTPSGSGATGGDTSEFSSPPITAINPFLVSSTADPSGAPVLGTLRYAITFSNNHPSPNASAPNDIQFQIAGVGLQTISLQQALPPVVAPLIIDGYTQSGARVNDSTQLVPPDTNDDQETDIAVIQIQVDGSGISGTNAMGLDIQAPGCTIDGLSLTGFSGAAIFLEPSLATISGAIGSTVWGNFIGVAQFNPHSTNPINPAANSAANGVGILIDGPNNVIGGTSPPDRNVIQGNRGDGIIVYGAQGTQNAIATDFILDNGGDGVLLLSAGTHVGQASGQGLAGAGNLISGNQGNGIHILDPSARGNTVANDEIGTQVGLAGQYVPILGTQPRPNLLSGVLIENAPANTIGGLVFDSGNVIAGNILDGVTIENFAGGTIPNIVSTPPAATPYTSGTRNVVEGNLIGVNNRNDLVQSIANQEDGVNISSSGNIIGGSSTAGQNIIAANRRNGITIAGIPLDASNNPSQTGVIPFPQPVANVVEGNFIGTVAGTDDYGNAFDGILIDQGGGNTIGGTASGAGNVVSNNGTGIAISGPLSAANLVAGNLVGTTSAGTAPMGNTADGIALVDASDNVIGGTTSGAANVIAANTTGIRLNGSGATGNLVEGNFIGTGSGGTIAMGNSLDGIAIEASSSSNTIGGTAAGAANTITNNGGVGVDVRSGVGNSILSNSIFLNDGTGIVLVGSANDGQAAPAITAATPVTTATLVSGTLSSSPSTSFLIQIFSSTTPDAAGSYEGETLVGSTTVTTDSSGQAGFGLALSANIPFGAAITATATSLTTGDTSAFSGSALNAPLIAFSTTQYYVSEPASAAVITITRNTGVGSSTVVYSATPGTAVAGVDFTPITAALTFAPGQTSATFSVPIIATQGRLGNFTVQLALSHPTGAGLGAPAGAVLTITSAPGSFQFSTATVLVPESAGGVTITVDRVGGASGTVSVNYATAAVNAIPGVDYLAVSGTLTFSAGVTQQSFTLPILGNSPNPNDATVVVSLSGVGGGASLGSPISEFVTIDKPLIVTGAQLTTGRGRITSVIFSFNKPLDSAQAVNLANFGYFVYWANAAGRFVGGATTTSLSAATYDQSNQSVTVALASALPRKRLYRLVINGNARPVLGNGLADIYGGLLEGSSGVPGTPYLVIFGAGKRPKHRDEQGKVVTPQSSQGGTMALAQSSSRSVQEPGRMGTDPGRSILTGSVRRGPGGIVRTARPSISGAAGVHIRLKGRPSTVAHAATVSGGRAFARRAWHH